MLYSFLDWIKQMYNTADCGLIFYFLLNAYILVDQLMFSSFLIVFFNILSV